MGSSGGGTSVSSGEGVSRPRGTTTPLRPWRETRSACETPRCSGDTALDLGPELLQGAGAETGAETRRQLDGDHPVRPGRARGGHFLPEPADAAFDVGEAATSFGVYGGREHDVRPVDARSAEGVDGDDEAGALQGPCRQLAGPGSPTRDRLRGGRGRRVRPAAARASMPRASRPAVLGRGAPQWCSYQLAAVLQADPSGQQARGEPKVDGAVHVGTAQCGQERDAGEPGQQPRRFGRTGGRLGQRRPARARRRAEGPGPPVPVPPGAAASRVAEAMAARARSTCSAGMPAISSVTGVSPHSASTRPDSSPGR